jgi:arylsulfatase A-like enzyme
MVRSIDIVPTLLDALDIEDPAGKLSPDGQSLQDGTYPDISYMETYHGQLTRENKLTHKLNEQYDFGWSEIDCLVGARTNEWKLICTANGGYEPSELYHIAQDPGEERNVIDDHPDVVEELFNHIEEWVSDDPQPYASAEEVDEEVREHLDDRGDL